MNNINATHDLKLKSWVTSANESSSDFPIQNLPFCSFLKDGDVCIGVGIGDQVVNTKLCAEAGLFDDAVAEAFESGILNMVMEMPASQRKNLRSRLSQLLSENDDELQGTEVAERALLAQEDCQFVVPCVVGDYTDFYASVFHATNIGSMFRPTNPLLPNYKHIPIGYHGRASSIVVSGADIRRPVGQQSPVEEGGTPQFGPCKLLDYELEVGFFVAEGNELGQPISIRDSHEHIFGMCLVNDWSARDLQKWEYQPLGPFLAKSFATTISPWIVTMEALAPFRSPAFARPAGDPQPLPYLQDAENEKSGGVDITLEVFLQSEKMRNDNVEAMRLSRGSFRDMYWTINQMLTHHSSNGCNLQPGDLMASGTVSGPSREARGCLMELTWDGDADNVVPGTQRTPIQLPTGEERKFLADGDALTIRGFCESEGARRIGFGSCGGTVLPAV